MHQRVKIVATIGPSTANSTKLKQMLYVTQNLQITHRIATKL